MSRRTTYNGTVVHIRPVEDKAIGYDPYVALAGEVCYQTAMDYRKAYAEICKHPHLDREGGHYRNEIDKCKSFFRSEWFLFLIGNERADSEWIINSIENEVRDELAKYGKLIKRYSWRALDDDRGTSFAL